MTNAGMATLHPPASIPRRRGEGQHEVSHTLSPPAHVGREEKEGIDLKRD